MREAEIKRRRQAPYPGLTFGVAVAVQYDPQRTIQGPGGHIVQLLRPTSCSSFDRRHALFENSSSNLRFNIWSIFLSAEALRHFVDGQQNLHGSV